MTDWGFVIPTLSKQMRGISFWKTYKINLLFVTIEIY